MHHFGHFGGHFNSGGFIIIAAIIIAILYIAGSRSNS